MSQDPAPTPADFMRASDLARHLQVDLAIQFKLEGLRFTPKQMAEHVAKRSALITVQQLFLDAEERLLKIPPP